MFGKQYCLTTVNECSHVNICAAHLHESEQRAKCGRSIYLVEVDVAARYAVEKTIDNARRSVVEPHDRIVQRLASHFVPNDGRFALIAQADRCKDKGVISECKLQNGGC